MIEKKLSFVKNNGKKAGKTTCISLLVSGVKVSLKQDLDLTIANKETDNALHLKRNDTDSAERHRDTEMQTRALLRSLRHLLSFS